MIRRIFVGGLSSLAVASAAFAALGHWRPTQFEFDLSTKTWLNVRSKSGLCSIAMFSEERPTLPPADWVDVGPDNVPVEFFKRAVRSGWLMEFGGPSFDRRRHLSFDGPAGSTIVWRNCIFPSWIAVALFSAYPMVAFIRGPVRRWRRRRNGWCLACGYDMQGNVSGVCPECGVAA